MFAYKMTLEKTQNRDVVAQKLQCYNSGGFRGEAGPKRTRESAFVPLMCQALDLPLASCAALVEQSKKPF